MVGVADEAYIKALERIIAEIHGCPSQHLETVRVHEVVVDRTVWEGDVEVFAVLGHPRAQRCFAWVPDHGPEGEPIRLFAVLETKLLRTALDAVKFVRVARSAELINKYSRLFVHS
jgi:hypothetical protein